MLIPPAFLNYGLARHCRWDLHLLIMEAAFLFGCHSFSASDSVGVPWERLTIHSDLQALQLFWQEKSSEGTENSIQHYSELD